MTTQADGSVSLEAAPGAIEDAIEKLKVLRDEYDEGKLEAFNGVSFLEVTTTAAAAARVVC